MMQKIDKKTLNKFPLPSNDAELEIISLIYFGKALHLSKLSLYGSGGNYSVLERYNDYHGDGWHFSKCSCRGYDYSADFWRHILGVLTCGGIAAHSYGQFKVSFHRHKARLEKWIDSRRGGDAGRVRKPFVRLAEKYGLGESGLIRGTPTLTEGRVDGASAVAN